MGYLELYDRNTCIVNNTCIKKVYKYCYFLPKKKLNSMIMNFFSVLLWSFNEIVFLFKES